MRKGYAQAAFVALLVVVVAVAGFEGGYVRGRDDAHNVPIMVADGYTGADQASFRVGEVWYGFEGAVDWTDEANVSRHGWPACLPHVAEVTGVRFAGGIYLVEGRGAATVYWVDCRGH